MKTPWTVLDILFVTAMALLGLSPLIGLLILVLTAP